MSAPKEYMLMPNLTICKNGDIYYSGRHSKYLPVICSIGIPWHLGNLYRPIEYCKTPRGNKRV